MKYLNQNQIVNNYQKFIKEVNSLKDKQRNKLILNMIQSIEQRLVFAPASTKTGFHGCFPGGLIWHTLSMLEKCRTLSKLYVEMGGSIDWNHDELTFACLFHDLGKSGDLTLQYYLPVKDNWHNSKGIFYQINREIDQSTVPQRSLFMLQTSGITMSKNEYYGILLSDGPFADDIRPYFSNFTSNHEFILPMIIHTGDWFSSKIQKDMIK